MENAHVLVLGGGEHESSRTSLKDRLRCVASGLLVENDATKAQLWKEFDDWATEKWQVMHANVVHLDYQQLFLKHPSRLAFDVLWCGLDLSWWSREDVENLFTSWSAMDVSCLKALYVSSGKEEVTRRRPGAIQSMEDFKELVEKYLGLKNGHFMLSESDGMWCFTSEEAFRADNTAKERLRMETSNTSLMEAKGGRQEDDQNHELLAVWADKRMPLIWREAVYTGKVPIMETLFQHQMQLLRDLLARDGKKQYSYVEVGCGTAEAGSLVFKEAKYTVGVEINSVMLELARELHPDMAQHDDVYLLEGNAIHLNEMLMQANLPPDFWQGKRLVTLLMNTFGILPNAIRRRVIQEMMHLAGAQGTVVIGCWHADSFAVGIEQFYKVCPALCGHFTKDMVDMPSATLKVQSTGYESHWWSANELALYVEEKLLAMGWKMETLVKGIGIFLILHPPSKASE